MDSAENTLAGGLPHSEIPGSKPARGSSGLFAACHVLHRLLAPRHPPDALHSLLPRRIASPVPSKTRREQGKTPPARTCRISLVKTLTLPNGFIHSATHSLFTMSKNKTTPWRRVCGPVPLFAKDAPGGGERDRTDDLLLAKQALSQLSYTPGRGSAWWAREDLNLRPHAYQARALTN